MPSDAALRNPVVTPRQPGFLSLRLDNLEQGGYSVGMEISTRIRDKGDRLVAEGRVTRLEAGRYQVEGDHGTYTVTVVDALNCIGWCNCQAVTVPCSHLYAATVVHLSTNEPTQPKLGRLSLVSPAGRDLSDPFDIFDGKDTR